MMDTFLIMSRLDNPCFTHIHIHTHSTKQEKKEKSLLKSMCDSKNVYYRISYTVELSTGRDHNSEFLSHSITNLITQWYVYITHFIFTTLSFEWFVVKTRLQFATHFFPLRNWCSERLEISKSRVAVDFVSINSISLYLSLSTISPHTHTYKSSWISC